VFGACHALGNGEFFRVELINNLAIHMDPGERTIGDRFCGASAHLSGGNPSMRR
jgi:hypothetical protein